VVFRCVKEGSGGTEICALQAMLPKVDPIGLNVINNALQPGRQSKEARFDNSLEVVQSLIDWSDHRINR